MKKLKIVLLLLLLLIIPTNTFAINEVNIYLFYSDACNICEQEKIYLEALKQRYPNMRVYAYEVGNSDNNNLMLKAKNLYNQTGSGVPFTVIGDSAYLGFSQNSKALVQKKVYEYSKNAYENKLGKELGITYRNDLEGEVQEYKDNDSYQIEEVFDNTQTSDHTNTQASSSYDKYKISIYLITVGVVLAFIAYVIHLLEKRGRI